MSSAVAENQNTNVITTYHVSGWAPPKKANYQQYLTPSLFILFLLFMMTNGKPFEQMSDILNTTTDSGEGDTLRQISYLLLFGLSCLSVLLARKWNVLKAYPPLILALALYSSLSATWSSDPSVSIRRSILSFVVLAGACNFISCLGWRRSVELFSWSLGFIMVVCLTSVIIVPHLAIHQASHEIGVQDPALHGAWKGLFMQKNHASAVASIAVIMFMHNYITTRRTSSLLILLISVIFLMGTRGKTSISILIPSLAIGIACRSQLASHAGKLRLAAFSLFTLAFGSIAATAFWHKIVVVFSDPTSFTGRVAIWRVALTFAKQHLLKGSGYGTFWHAGIHSDVYHMPVPFWVHGVLHSHNGFLEMFVFLGLPGLLLAIIAVVVMPIIYLSNVSKENAKIAGMLMSVWLYCFFHNFLEAFLLAKDKQVWVCMLIAISCLRLLAQERPSGARRMRQMASNLVTNNVRAAPPYGAAAKEPAGVPQPL